MSRVRARRPNAALDDEPRDAELPSQLPREPEEVAHPDGACSGPIDVQLVQIRHISLDPEIGDRFYCAMVRFRLEVNRSRGIVLYDANGHRSAVDVEAVVIMRGCLPLHKQRPTRASRTTAHHRATITVRAAKCV
jgi:hypothetical protein